MKRLPQVREGALRALLASYKAPPLTLHAVFPPTQHLAVKVRLFIDFLAVQRSGQMIALGIDMERPLVAPNPDIGAPQSITSSALISSEFGMVRPNAFAGFRSMTSSRPGTLGSCRPWYPGFGNIAAMQQGLPAVAG